MDSLTQPRKAEAGDKIAVLSPSLAAPAIGPAVHEQALERLRAITGLVPVEFPTTRRLGATARERADDLNAAFADPSIRAIIATAGGDDEMTVLPLLDAEPLLRDPKPVLGYSDNTNLHHWLWSHGVCSFHGGATQVHLGPGPDVDAIHRASLRAALLTGESLEITEPGYSEDFGKDWADPRALTEYGARERTDSWLWDGPATVVSGPGWGGCLEMLVLGLAAGRIQADASALDGCVLMLETSELLPSRELVAGMLRSLGERGVLEAAAAILLARPPASSFQTPSDAEARARYRREQAQSALEVIRHYNTAAPVCTGIPFGHTRPQWILPHGGALTVDAASRRITASYA
ncbi:MULTISPECIES: S66 peptidase family protein [unclassified Actinomyces]|uniref:S66 family peptidase n=1 Tax=unclassified Actinomyces TaxID=2609248 RepID=UPI0013A6CCC6|nr:MULTISPECIES: S66 peptidase family protein [unclassified Actinomyces]MBW3068241.1 LD-carboxypeptidase [Actinomyces sp. 594]NDR53612.1 LD-carboxypeptidase [Actinomyces sp. 565]